MLFFRHNFHLKNYGILLLCFFSANHYGQNYVDLAKVSGSTTPLNTFHSSSTASVLNEYTADVFLPVKLKKNTTFLTGLIYEQVQTKLFSEQSMQRLSSVTLKLGWNHIFNKHFSATVVLLPKLATNFGKLSEKDMQMGAITVFKYSVNANLNYKYGLYYNVERFGPFFVPLLGCYYMSGNKRLEINLMLPLSVDLNYRLVSWLNAGLNFNGQTRSYHVSNSKPGLNSAYVSRTSNEVFGYLKFNFGNNFSCQAKLGRSFGRKYRVYKTDDRVDFALPLVFVNDHRQQLNTDFSDGLIFQAALIYRIQLNN